MSLTLLVENNPKIESFYMLNLTTWLGLDIMTLKKAESALEHLEKDDATVNLIVVRSQIGKEASAKLIIDYLIEKKLSIPVIVVGKSDVPGSFAFVPNSLELKVLIQSAARALNITAKDMSEKIVPDYYPIPIMYFQNLHRSVCPVYLQDTTDQDTYHQRLAAQVEFPPDMILNLIQEGTRFLYVNKLDRLAFVNNVTSELMAQLSGADLSPDELITSGDRSIDLLSKKLLTIGLNEETIKLANRNMQIMKKNVKSFPKLAKLLDRLLSNNTGKLFMHTQILTYVGLHIVQNIDWGNADQEEKISFIAFFHDIVLEDDEQCSIKSTLELKKSSLQPDKKSLVEKHAQLAAEIVTKFPHAPMGADQIIRQHHGTLNGIGFSEHFGNNVSPMSIVFIVAEEFTRIILDSEERPLDKKELIRALKEEFPTSRFQKVINLLESITL